jgi:two-component system OmpR family sensor kinase
MIRLPLPRGIRNRLFVTVVIAVALALAVTIAGFNVLLDRSLSSDADKIVHERAAAELALLDTSRGGLAIRETPDDAAVDTPIWVFTHGRTLEAPRTGRTVTEAAQSLAGGPARTLDVSAADTRLYAVPIVTDGRRIGTVIAGVSLAPYEQTQRTALYGSLALGGLLLVMVALAAGWLLRSSLRPVSQMTRLAAAWSERDLDRRFSLGEPYDELTQLAATLDDLLDRLATSLRRERRFSAELSHELRTPLASLIAEAELALRRERPPKAYRAALEVVHRNAQQIARIVEALVAAARHESDAVRGTTDAFAAVEQALEAVAGLRAERRIEVVAERPPLALRLGVDRDLAERILQPVIENACRYCRRSVQIAIESRDGRVLYVVEDDGPGVLAEERDSIFEPGVRGSAGQTTSGGSGAGLGLALARRLARTAAGEVSAEPNEHGRFVVSLPAV